jgi:hypothetical protein
MEKQVLFKLIYFYFFYLIYIIYILIGIRLNYETRNFEINKIVSNNDFSSHSNISNTV